MSQANNYLKHSVSAGGVVVGKIDGVIKILLIKDGKVPDWVLPKGHVQVGETFEQAALREVAEETGLKNIDLVKKLGTKEREPFARPDEWKIIHYFLFTTTNDDKPKSQEAKHYDWMWVEPREAIPKMHFAEQQEIVQENLEDINDHGCYIDSGGF